VDLTPEDHPDRAGWLSELSDALSRRYQKVGQKQDIEDAVRTLRLAITLTPENDPNRARWLNEERAMLQISQVCLRCNYIHSPGQICPRQYFLVRVGLKDSGKLLGSVAITCYTSDTDLDLALLKLYKEAVSLVTRLTRVYSLSSTLYLVS
jgi:hypothetical protein